MTRKFDKGSKHNNYSPKIYSLMGIPSSSRKRGVLWNAVVLAATRNNPYRAIYSHVDLCFANSVKHFIFASLIFFKFTMQTNLDTCVQHISAQSVFKIGPLLRKSKGSHAQNFFCFVEIKHYMEPSGFLFIMHLMKTYHG